MSQIVVSQLGARMHYAVPRILAARGLLAHFYTDIVATQGWPRALARVPSRYLPGAIRRLTARRPNGIPPDRITTFPRFGLQSALRRLSSPSRNGETRDAIWAGRRLSELVAARGFHGARGLYAFSGDALEQFRAANEQGLWCTLEQMIAPRDVVERLFHEEAQRFPHWVSEETADHLAQRFADRERAEWKLARLIICPSEFVRRNTVARGADPARCVTVPYGVDASFVIERGGRRPGPLRVLTVGAVGLRKGSPYVVEAARMLGGKAKFRMVGPCTLPSEIASSIRRQVELTGPVPRNEMQAQFAWADLFLLPSLCEGSATSVYEAMAAGLPVICTENTGSVVRDGIDGFIVPIRSADAVAEAVEWFVSDPGRIAAFSLDAANRAGDYTLERYGDRLVGALAALLPQMQASRQPCGPACLEAVMP